MDHPAAQLEQTVREVVAGRTVMAPVRTSDLLNEIDYRLRLRPTPEDLKAAIRRIADAGSILEMPDGGLVDGRSSGRPPSSDDGVAREPPTDEQLLVTIPFDGDGRPTARDWQIAEDLACRVCQELGDRGRSTRVVSLKVSPGRIDFAVLGHGSNDPSTLRAMVLPLFERLAPPGSSVLARP